VVGQDHYPPENAELLSDLDAEFIPLGIERKPSPWRDFLALIRLVKLFRRERFDLVHSIGPRQGYWLCLPVGWPEFLTGYMSLPGRAG